MPKTASLFVFPVVMRPAFHDPAWREQYERECLASSREVRPPRTRPLLVIDNERARLQALYGALLSDIAHILQEA